MMRNLLIFFFVAVGTFIVDQSIKIWAMDAVKGIEYMTILKGSCIDLELHYNRGVAFSMLAFLGDNLKWVQLTLIVGIIAYIFYEGYVKQYAFALGLIVGGAVGNLYDRFIHEGVVDYVAWHCGFNFAVFNYADVMIDLGVAIILLMTFLEYLEEKNKEI
jgi:signal peptidase II